MKEETSLPTPNSQPKEETMMRTHSYTDRIFPPFPFITYLPHKPKPLPSRGSRQAERPIQPRKKHQSHHGSKHTGLEPTL
jgi:hypothetical protein